MWGWNWLENLLQDGRYGFRMLIKNPGFAAAAVITLALGIGANTATFSVVNAVLLRPLPCKNAGRLAVVLHHGRYPWRQPISSIGGVRIMFSTAWAAAEAWGPNLTEVDKPEPIAAMHVTADILPTLGVQPILGRFFLPEEDAPGKEHEVVLDYCLWQRRFAGDCAPRAQRTEKGPMWVTA